MRRCLLRREAPSPRAPAAPALAPLLAPRAAVAVAAVAVAAAAAGGSSSSLEREYPLFCVISCCGWCGVGCVFVRKNTNKRRQGGWVFSVTYRVRRATSTVQGKQGRTKSSHLSRHVGDGWMGYSVSGSPWLRVRYHRSRPNASATPIIGHRTNLPIAQRKKACSINSCSAGPCDGPPGKTKEKSTIHKWLIYSAMMAERVCVQQQAYHIT